MNSRYNGEQRVALQRWHAGHHVFFVLIQGIIVALTRFERALAAGNITAAREALRVASVLMVASAAAMRFAGMYSRTAYDDAVVPTMSPPNARMALADCSHAITERWFDC